ncbi:YcaO-like family protein [Pseudomonas putida]
MKPDFKCDQPNAVAYLPHSMETGSRWETFGSSSGWKSNIIDSAHGEYLERKHFYFDIPVNDYNTLGTALMPKEVAEFTRAFRQTTSLKHPTTIESHHLDLTTAYRLTDFTKCKIPSACLLINPSPRPLDNQLYPIRDTCACSAHVSVDKAILGSLKESFERQFLLRYWLTKTATAKIQITTALKILKNSPARRLVRGLAESGELCILDITDARFPGACILVCFGNNSSKPNTISYCAGMAYSDNLSAALEKAAVELWQTYRFIQSFSARGKSISEIEDPYLRHFLICNNYETFKTVSDIKVTELRKLDPQPLGTRSLISIIRQLDLNGYLYISQTQQNYSTIYFCKYVSPNIFLHMNNSRNFNLINTYSHDFLDSILPGQKLKMVPFP